MRHDHDSIRLIEQSIRHSRAIEGARNRSWLRSLRPRETLATIMLGTASCSLGLVVLVAAIAGSMGKSWAPWNEELAVMTEAVPRQYERVGFPGREESLEVKMVVGTTVLVPSASTAGLGLLGALLGGAGLALSRRYRQLSALSTLGIALPFAVLFLELFYILILNIIY